MKIHKKYTISITEETSIQCNYRSIHEITAFFIPKYCIFNSRQRIHAMSEETKRRVLL